MAVFSSGIRLHGGLLSGWRGLARFWGALILLLGVGGAMLQILGSPPERPAPAGPVVRAEPAPAAHSTAEAKLQEHPKAAPQPVQPGRSVAGPIGEPDPAMQEPFPGDPKLHLPRVSIDGRAPMSAYAAAFDPSSLRPRVAILIAGIGMREGDSLAAIKDLPGGVSLAISPYAGDINRLLTVARLNQHEYLLSVPMEPQSYPVNDPDDRFALMTSLSPADNLNRLLTILSRQAGYAGVTNALGPMRGERFSGLMDQLDPVLEEVADRGLLFLDARIGQKPLPHVWNRSADMILDDDPLDAAALDQRLDTLTHMALDKGSALGIISVPRPVTIERLAAWTNTLASKGVVLAPVSALMLPPAKQGSEKNE